MKKLLPSAILLIIAFVPGVIFAQLTDIDPNGSSACADINVNLAYGAKDTYANGNAVSMLQDFLSTNGYLSVSYSGYFGKATLAAVKSFQIANGINGSGYVGPLTRGKIKAIDCNGESTTTPVLNNQPVIVTPVSTSGLDTATSCKTQGTVMFGSGSGYIGCDIVANGTFNLANSYCAGQKTGRKQTALMPDAFGRANYFWNTLSGLDMTEQVDVFINANGRYIQCTPSLNVQGNIQINNISASITRVYPSQVVANTSATVYGTNLTAATRVSFYSLSGTYLGDLPLIYINSSQMQFTVPSDFKWGAGSYQINLTSPGSEAGVNTNKLPFTITAPVTLDTATSCVTQGGNTYPGGIAADENGLIGCDIVANGTFNMSKSYCQGQISNTIKKVLQHDDYGRANYYYTTLTGLMPFEHVNVLISSNGNLIQCTPAQPVVTYPTQVELIWNYDYQNKYNVTTGSAWTMYGVLGKDRSFTGQNAVEGQSCVIGVDGYNQKLTVGNTAQFGDISVKLNAVTRGYESCKAQNANGTCATYTSEIRCIISTQ